MQIFTSLKDIPSFLFNIGIAFICLAYSYQSFFGSHLHAQVLHSPYLLYAYLFFLITIPFCICFFSGFRLTLLIFIGIVSAAFGESYYRAAFHLLFISFLLLEFVSPVSLVRTSVNAVKSISLLGVSLFFIYLHGLSTYVWYEFDYYIFKDLVAANASIAEIVNESGLVPIREIVYFIEFLVLIKFAQMLSRRFSCKDWKDSFTYVLAPVVFVIPFFLFFQIHKVHPVFYINQNAFWDFSGRFSALFSDPNAFGVMSGIILLLIPCIYEMRSVFFKVSLLLTIFLSSLWSGSRTFFIFVALFIIFKLYGKISAKIISSSWYVISGSIFATVLLVVSIFLVDSPSLTRLKDTFNPSKVESMLESRFLFSRLAIASVRESPLGGIGLGRFYHTQDRIAERNAISLGDWRDNANNYYLQIATEFGLPALLFLFFVLYRIRKMGGEVALPNTLRSIILIFLLSLLTGPHLHFLEVRFLLFLLLVFLASCETGNCTTNDSINLRPVMLLCLFFLLTSIWWNYQPKVTGLYGTENDTDSSFRWSTSTVNIPVCTKESFFLEVKNPLFAFVEKDDESTQKIIYGILQREFPVYSWNEFSITNETDWHQLPIPAYTKNIKLLIRDSISPSAKGLSDDPRVLGVQIKVPIESCLN